MNRFTTRAAGALVAAAIAFGTAASADASRSSDAQAACMRATIVGQSKCIAAGQYCKHTARANRDYHRYGYHCGRRDYRGSWHLTYR